MSSQAISFSPKDHNAQPVSSSRIPKAGDGKKPSFLRSLDGTPKAQESTPVFWSCVVVPPGMRRDRLEENPRLISGGSRRTVHKLPCRHGVDKPSTFGSEVSRAQTVPRPPVIQRQRQCEQEGRGGQVLSGTTARCVQSGRRVRALIEDALRARGAGRWARALADPVSSVPGFSRHLSADGLEVARNPTVEPGTRGRRGPGCEPGRVSPRSTAPLKWRTASQQVVQERTQGIEIGGGPDRAREGGHLLGGHVGRSSLGAVRAGLRCARLAFEAGDAEVGDLWGDGFPGGFRPAVEQDVRRFEIEVNNPAGVEVSDGAKASSSVSRAADPERKRLRQAILECSSRHIFKDEP